MRRTRAISLPEELYEWLVERAELEDRPVSTVVRRALELYKEIVESVPSQLISEVYWDFTTRRWQLAKPQVTKGDDEEK